MPVGLALSNLPQQVATRGLHDCGVTAGCRDCGNEGGGNTAGTVSDIVVFPRPWGLLFAVTQR